jgi:hypothetical protein
MTSDYMQQQAEMLAQHLRLTDGKSGYVEASAEGFDVFIRKKWPGKLLASWDGMPVEWHLNVGTHKAARR